MTRPTLFSGSVLAVLVAAGTYVGAAGLPVTVAVEPRIVEARLARVSLEEVDVSLRVALRASHTATIRSIAFTDAFVGRVPVWIAPIDGKWPLVSGSELVIPQAMQVRLHARDAVGADDLGAIVRKGAVTVRASVEVAIETPWLARLLFMDPTQTLVKDVVLEVPIETGSGYMAPLARIGADLADVAQRGAATWLASGLNRLPGRSSVLARFGGRVATVTTRYAVEGQLLPLVPRAAASRERRAAGIWWSPSVFCTTREALEPWRFDAADATTLQLAGGRLRREGGGVHVEATREHAALDVDLAVLDRALPSPQERKLYALVDGRPGRLRLGDREAASNLVCLQVADGGMAADAAATRTAGGASTAATTAGAATGSAVTGDVAAFAPGRSVGVIWTGITGTRRDRLQLSTPLYRGSFGSPLVSGDRVVGLVASSTSAWPASAVTLAAARALRLPASRAASTATNPTNGAGR